jgi:hypothetical protein
VGQILNPCLRTVRQIRASNQAHRRLGHATSRRRKCIQGHRQTGQLHRKCGRVHSSLSKKPTSADATRSCCPRLAPVSYTCGSTKVRESASFRPGGGAVPRGVELSRTLRLSCTPREGPHVVALVRTRKARGSSLPECVRSRLYLTASSAHGCPRRSLSGASAPANDCSAQRATFRSRPEQLQSSPSLCELDER